MMKEIKDDANKWNDIPFILWTGRMNIIHTTQSNVKVQCNPYQNSNKIFYRNRTNNLKMCMEPQKTLNS